MANRSGHHRRTHFDSLTGRQREVLEQMALGKTNLEIAEHLGIGFESVKSHVSDILLRLDVSSREEAITAWQREGGVLSRLRRTATGFFVTGFGKAALAGMVALLAVGVGAALFLGGDGDPGSNDVSEALPALDTYLIDDGREVHQALAEAEERYGFPLVVPTGSDYRLAGYYHEPRSPIVLGGFRSILTGFHGVSGERRVSVEQVNTEIDSVEGVPVDSGRADVDVFRFDTGQMSVYQAYGRGRGFIVNAGPGQPAEDEVLELVRALFDAAPGQLPPPWVVQNIPNPLPAETPLPAVFEIANGVTDGTDFVVGGRDPEDVRDEASQTAGFEIALPTTIPAGMQLVQIRLPLVVANPELRSAYLSLHREGANATTLLVQHNRELVAPAAEWGTVIATGVPGISAWHIGDFRDPEPVFATLAAVGNGRTVAIRYVADQLTQAEALAIVIATLEAVK